MDLIQLIIELISNAFEKPKTRIPTANNSDDMVRQIQARIEAARIQDARARQAGESRPLFAQLPPQVQQSGRPPTAGFKPRKQKRKAPPALPRKLVAVPAAKVIAPKPVAPPSPPPKPAVVNVDAKVLSRWLRPQTLRTQFIVTEIFQPPVALRESHLI
jgi:hypothetical protein